MSIRSFAYNAFYNREKASSESQSSNRENSSITPEERPQEEPVLEKDESDHKQLVEEMLKLKAELKRYDREIQKLIAHRRNAEEQIEKERVSHVTRCKELRYEILHP